MKAYSKFNIYKGKAAMQVSLIPPTFSGSNKGNSYVSREGTMLLEFANANQNAAPQGPGANRTYSWDQKVTFALSALELGSVLSDDGKGVEFYHDPGKGTPNEGSIRKTLKLQHNQDGSFFLSVSYNNNSTSTRQNVSVPISRAEMTVLRSLMNYAIPRLMGFDATFELGMNVTPPPYQG